MAERQRRWSRSLAGAAVVAVAVLAAAVYVTLGGEGNGDPACAAVAPQAAALDPLATGELAAFKVAEKPERLADLAFKDTAGADATLARFSGKVALVNLWATWCVPCRQEMPALDRLALALGGDDFEVVPVSIDVGDASRPTEFLQSIGVKNLPLYTDRTTAIFEALKRRGLAVGLPVTVLLDRAGCSLGHINGPAEWDSEDGRKLIEAAIAGSARKG